MILNVLFLLPCPASHLSSDTTDLKLSSKLPGIFSSSLTGFLLHLPHRSPNPSSLHLLQDFRGLLRSVFPLSFISFSPSSSSCFSSSWCVGCSQAWRRGGGVWQPQSPEQRRWRRQQQQHQELGAGREHQPPEHHQRELSGAAGGRASFPVSSCQHPPSGAPRGGLLLRRVEGPDAAFWLKQWAEPVPVIFWHF